VWFDSEEDEEFDASFHFEEEKPKTLFYGMIAALLLAAVVTAAVVAFRC